MSKSKPTETPSAASGRRRQFTKEFKEQAVQMLLDGHSAPSIVERLGLSGTNLLYRWRRDLIDGCENIAYPLRPKMANAFFKMSRSC